MIWHNILLGKLPETIQKWNSVPECTPDAGRCSRKLWWEGRVSTLSRENFHPRKSPHLGYCASYFSWFCLVLWNHPVSRAQATVCSTSHRQAKSPTLSFPNLLSSFRSLCIWTVCPFSLFPPNLNCGKDSFLGGGRRTGLVLKFFTKSKTSLILPGTSFYNTSCLNIQNALVMICFYVNLHSKQWIPQCQSFRDYPQIIPCGKMNTTKAWTFLTVQAHTPDTKDTKVPCSNESNYTCGFFLDLFLWNIISPVIWAFNVHTTKPERCVNLLSTHMHWLVLQWEIKPCLGQEPAKHCSMFLLKSKYRFSESMSFNFKPSHANH